MSYYIIETTQLSGGLDVWILTRNGEEEQTTAI